jgi:hypothetical protein
MVVFLLWIASVRSDCGSCFQDGTLLFAGPAILTWYRRVFHRVKSDDQVGSASLNLALRDETFDLKVLISPCTDWTPKAVRFK